MKKELELKEPSYPFNEKEEYIKDGMVYCKKCHERLDINPIKFLHSKIFPRECHCKREEKKAREERLKQEEINRLKRACFKSPVQWEYTFDNFRGSPTQPYIIAKNFAKEFSQMKKENIGLLFYGSVGSGKSYLASAIANHLIEEERIRVLIKNFAEIINDIQIGGFQLDKNEYIGKLANVPLLILDDLGIERDTSYAKEQVYNIINSRYLKQKPTIITTNLALETITHGENDIEYQRIYSRILEMCIPVMVVGKDIRRNIQQEKLESVKETLLYGGGGR
ncbi:ATP-binding protein [Facklamia sp. P9177]|uniref:ATP-binding protein n=1 Tax=Facklamia sp. P9177 TaxID=3421945 RepID=UPI003D16DE9E